MKKEIYEKLKNDEDYYGDFGKQFLSNSDVSTLLKNPLQLHQPLPRSPAFLLGGYFHTSILEPEKLKNFKIVEAKNRNTKKYKEDSKGEMCLLSHEAEKISAMVEKLMSNDICRDLIKPAFGNVQFEEPMVTKLFGNMWKGKADIVNHDEKLVIDLKTTGDIDRFEWSASKFNYDSQAYIYSQLFGYDMLFIAMDKNSNQIGVFDCSKSFYNNGKDKVEQASKTYDLFYKNKDFDTDQHLITKTL